MVKATEEQMPPHMAAIERIRWSGTTVCSRVVLILKKNCQQTDVIAYCSFKGTRKYGAVITRRNTRILWAFSSGTAAAIKKGEY